MTARNNQRGSALLIVLLLAATLSFVALSAMERTSLAAARAGNVTARSEALWRALAVETLAVAVIRTAYETNHGKMSLDDPWAAAPVDLPMDGGAARVVFTDATACFNINSLGARDDEAAASAATVEFIRLAGHLGIGEFDARALAEAIADWIDQDTNRRPQGAEDEYYTTLPSPYRAGNAPMAAVSELRAVKGVNRDVYAALKPALCALRDAGPSPVNVNMLAERHAPVLAAMLGDKATLQAAAEIIAARPPGGYDKVENFLATPALKALDVAGTGRFQTTSRYVLARAEIVYDTALLEMTSEIAVGGSGAQVILRRIGAEE